MCSQNSFRSSVAVYRVFVVEKKLPIEKQIRKLHNDQETSKIQGLDRLGTFLFQPLLYIDLCISVYLVLHFGCENPLRISFQLHFNIMQPSVFLSLDASDAKCVFEVGITSKHLSRTQNCFKNCYVAVQQLTKLLYQVASAGFGLDHIAGMELLNRAKSAGGLAVAILLKPFSFEGQKRLEEVLLTIASLFIFYEATSFLSPCY